jgi:GNAT superfamily N-acetyltransferase
MAIEYKINEPLTADEFIDILRRSSLAERRPVADRACVEGMVAHANLWATAWDGARLVGVSRSVTDFHYACYLSDLAVDQAYQRSGIGARLIAHTQTQLGPHCVLRLIAAPAAADYYPHIGMTNNARCWELRHGEAVKS